MEGGEWDSSRRGTSVLSGGDGNILYIVVGDGPHRGKQFQNLNRILKRSAFYCI